MYLILEHKRETFYIVIEDGAFECYKIYSSFYNIHIRIDTRYLSIIGFRLDKFIGLISASSAILSTKKQMII